MSKFKNPFTATRDFFMQSVSPCTYEEWLEVPDSLKCATLFVTFFDTITLAYVKAYASFIEEEQFVSTVIQYLQKNVESIKERPDLYTEKYIYRVAYNSMGCLRRYKVDIARNENTTPNIVKTADGEVDLFNGLTAETDVFSLKTKNAILNTMLKLIDEFEEDGEGDSILKHVFAGKRLHKSIKKDFNDFVDAVTEYLIREDDMLDEYGVISTLEDVVKYEKFIDSAVIDFHGVKCVYFGEKKTDLTGTEKVLLMGPVSDYYVPVSCIHKFSVMSVEFRN